MREGELKWTKVSRGKYPVYKDVVDLYFSSYLHQGAEFHAIVLDTHGIDHGTYNQGDADLGFNKFLFNLLYYRVGLRFGELEKIVVDMDARNTTHEPAELQGFLNRKLASRFGSFDHHPFTRIAQRDSKKSRMVQLADLLAGSVAWHKNDHDTKSGASEAKTNLANHIAQSVGLRRLGASSPRSEKRLSVWNFQLGPRGRGAR